MLVSDGEHTTPEMDFAVLLLSNHQQPPLFQVLDPVLEVSMGGQAPIGKTSIHTFQENEWLKLCVRLKIFKTGQRVVCVCVCVCKRLHVSSCWCV